ncbi:MAG: UvrD-helicase domain-containing protein [Balneolaceae bacterium]|nr:UvrD-helicase domain-containing protein [Balneolaceae bacterium]
MKTFSLQPQEPQQPADFLKGLNKQQHEAVTTTNGPLLIVAGAGSGKTRVLTFRIAYLLQQFKAAPNEILALTFTNKAAREMKERILKLIGDKAQKLWMGTFHSIFSKILRFEAEKLGYGKDFTIYDTSDSEQVIKQILQELNFDPKEIKPKTIRNKISDAKNQLISTDAYQNRFVSSTLDDITSRVYTIYQKRLKQSNAMDFDDLLVKPIELFEENPELLEQYQDRFKYILIDEYQDTNHAQYKVTKMLAAKYQNICVVGDDAQSIYSFRGADISNILNFKEDYENAKQVPLEQNYRSSRSILQCADSIIKKNSNQLDKTLWTEKDYGDPVVLLKNYDERDEANRIAQHIIDLKMRHGYNNNQMAILYRTNYQSRVFEEALRRHDLAYQLIGGLSFYQRKEIKDVLAYLTLLVNKHDETNLVRIINEPSRGIGNKSINDLRIQARETGQTMWDILENVEETNVYKPAKVRIRAFVDMINKIRSDLALGITITEATRSVLEQSGYMKALVEENSQESMMRRENILELQNAISYYERGKTKPSLSAFLQEISLITDGDKFDENKPAITLMTVHGSKGLEFPVVFVVGLEENLFPVGGRDGFDADIEEERRLFYVAITRAEERLYFSHCKSRFKFGEEQQQLRSRFLDEVDPGVVRTETGATISQRQDRFSSEGTSDDNGTSSYVEYDWQKPKTKKTGSSSLGSIHYEYEAGEDPFVVGAEVVHAKFGPGKIISRSGLGMDAKVVVFFKKRGQKKLMLRAAPLQLID